MNGSVFIFQDRACTLADGSLDCLLFYKDLLQPIKPGNVKQAKSITLAITP